MAQSYTITFITSDIISLVLQSFGWGITSTPSDVSTSNMGLHIMVAGLVFQLLYSCAVHGALCGVRTWCAPISWSEGSAIRGLEEQ